MHLQIVEIFQLSTDCIYIAKRTQTVRHGSLSSECNISPRVFFFFCLSVDSVVRITGHNNSNLEFYLFDFNRFALNMELCMFVEKRNYALTSNMDDRCKEVDLLRGSVAIVADTKNDRNLCK